MQLLQLYPPETEVQQASIKYLLVHFYNFFFAAGEDYVRLDGVSVTFLPGEFTQRVSLNTLADLPAEGDEDLFATLSAVDARVDVTEPEATIIITEDGM